MKSGALLGIVGVLGVAGYFGYDWYQTEQREKQAKVDADKALAARNQRNIEPETKARPVAIEMPKLEGLTFDQAKETLIKAGFTVDKFKILEHSECSYPKESEMKPKGQICSQEPEAKQKALPNARIEVVVEVDTYEEGGIGSPSAWKRMPEVVGLTETAAKGILRGKGFADDEFDFRREQGCGTPGLVCSTTPEPLTRKIRGRMGTILIGD